MNISWSKINLYRQCPFKWKKVNIDRIYEPETIYLWRGKVLHACLEKLGNQCFMQNIEPLGTFIDEFKHHFMRKTQFKGALQNRMKTEGQDILTQFYFLVTECGLFQNIEKVEYYFKIPFDKYTFITGKIDRIDIVNNKLRLVDYKDGREKPFKEYADQLKIYQWAVQQQYTNYDVDTIGIHLLASNHILSEPKFDKTDITTIVDEISLIIGQIEAKQFEPQINQWCKYCSFRDECGLF